MSQVIINDVPPRTQAFASGGQVIFGTNWTANAASDVVVYVTPVGDDPDDFNQILSYPSQYTVTFVGALLEVQVELVTPSTLGDIVTIIRMTPADRENLYSNTNFIPSMLNNDFGILTLVDQQAQLVDQLIGPRYNYSAQIINVLDTILPILGPNQFWAKNLTDTAIIAIDVSDVISGGTVTQIDTGVGLTGGPITTIGTISFAPIAASSLWANTTAGVAVPTVTSLSSLSGLILPPSSTARQMLQSQVLANPVWSTSTWPDTTTQNQLLYSSFNNVVSEIPGANNSVLITGVSGIPSLSTTLPQAVQTNIQYLGIQNQNLDMGGFQINDMAEPIQPSDAATKNYVDLNALTGTSVYAATTANLTVTQSGSGVGATLTNAGVQAIFALDGVNPPLASLVLIKNLAILQNEGIYTVTNVGSGATNWVLTRAATFDTPTEINQTGLIIVQNGLTLAGTAWYNTATIVTVDVTPLNFSQFGSIIFPVSLSNGGTNANLVASAGSVVYSTPTAMAFTAVGSTGQLLRSTGVTAPGWTTAIFDSTYAASSLLYSNGANNVQGLSTLPSAGLLTNASGVPAWVTATGTGAPVLGTAPTISAPKIDQINDQTFNAPVMTFSGAASAVNYVTTVSNITGAPVGFQFNGSDANVNANYTTKGIGTHSFYNGLDISASPIFVMSGGVTNTVNYILAQSNVTTGSPVLSATGGDTNITLILAGKGTGGAAIAGTSTNDSALVGYVGQFLSSTVLFGSALAFTNGVASNLAAITLGPGDWDVWGNFFASAGSPSMSAQTGLNTTANVMPDTSLITFNATASTASGIVAPMRRFSVNTNTIVYIVAIISGTGSLTGSGGIYARRRR